MAGLCFGCSQADSQIARPELFIAPDATDLKVYRNGQELAFVVDEPYPAERLQLRLQGIYHPPDWAQKDELKMFPGTKTSDYPTGWSSYLENGKKVRRWMANWERDEMVAFYVITYRTSDKAEVQAFLFRR